MHFQKIFVFSSSSVLAVEPNQRRSPWVLGGSPPPVDKAVGSDVDSHLHLEALLRMNGAIPLVPLYAFLALTRTIIVAVREEID